MKNNILHEDKSDEEKEAGNAEREKETRPELSYDVRKDNIGDRNSCAVTSWRGERETLYRQ